MIYFYGAEMKGKVIFFSTVVIGLLLALPIYNSLYKPELFNGKDIRGRANNLFNMDVVESLLSSIAIKMGISVEPTKVMVGKDGWLFLGDSFVHTLTRKIDGADFHEKEIDEVHQTMHSWNQYFKENGVKAFRVIIGPDKDSVYADKLPKWDKHHHNRILSSLISKGGDLYISTYAAILKEKNTSAIPLYYHTDTHWNAYGASVAFNELAKNISNINSEIKWPTLTVNDFKIKQGKPEIWLTFLG